MGMDHFHEQLARVALGAADSYGFVLAGGYAIQAVGILERPSNDVDLFTTLSDPGRFTEAVEAVVAAYSAEGWTATVTKRDDTFARLWVEDSATGSESKVEMSRDPRERPPLQMSIGPVLHPDDSLTNKMSAIGGRTAARDFIDVDAALCSGEYTRERLIELASIDRGFDPRVFAQRLLAPNEIDEADFAVYGVYGRQLEALKARFAEWREELLAQ